ncbi:MAG: hypothetical protein H0U89_00880 [Acidimicrobiia bacterium]|nr:hypothetical protein [Acidimicrobiia bacterium]
MATIEDYAPTGSPISSVERVSRRARAGRICKEQECATKLSVYNDGSFCSIHAPMVVPRTRGKKLAP